MEKQTKFIFACLIVGFLFTLANCIFDYFGKVRIAKTEARNAALEQKYSDTELKQKQANDHIARLTVKLIENSQKLDSLERYSTRLQSTINATSANYAAIKKALAKPVNYADSTKAAILNNLPK